MSLLTPVRYPVKYYSWQDIDAPQLSDTDGVIKTILKACLITGYGSKEGAGWQLIEEDGDMMVIRRPLGIGNPPDIKIENGQVGGETKYRIVAQDGTGELVSLDMLSRDNACGQKWHLAVCDFGFLLCYQMGSPYHYLGGRTHIKQAVIYVGSISKIRPDSHEPFVIGAPNDVYNGRVHSQSTASILSPYFTLIDVATKINITQKYALSIGGGATEMIAGAYVAQPVWVSDIGKMPFYTALFSSAFEQLNLDSQLIQLAGRPCLRYVNMPGYYHNGCNVLYIPLDYWEL